MANDQIEFGGILTGKESLRALENKVAELKQDFLYIEGPPEEAKYNFSEDADVYGEKALAKDLHKYQRAMEKILEKGGSTQEFPLGCPIYFMSDNHSDESTQEQVELEERRKNLERQAWLNLEEKYEGQDDLTSEDIKDSIAEAAIDCI